MNEPTAVLDAVGPLERIKLSGELASKVKELALIASPIQRISVASRVAAILRELGAAIAPATEPKKIRNFGWDRVKLSDLSMEDLRTLRERVEAEHANPFTEAGRYTENGQPSLYVYDKKGRWKLDQLGWAVTYKLQEAKQKAATPAPVEMPSGWSEKLLSAAEAQDIVTPEQVRALMDGHEGMFESASFRGEASADDIAEKVKTLTDARLGKEVERGAMLKQSGQWNLAINSAMSQLALSRTLVNIGTRKNAQAPDGFTGVGTPYFQRAEMYANGGKAQLASARGIAAFLAALEIRAAKPKKPSTASFDKHLLSPDDAAKRGPTPAHPDNGRAAAGGSVGMNGEFYKGGSFLPRTTLPKQGAAAGSTTSGRGVLIEPGVFEHPPTAGAKSIFGLYGEFIHVTDGVASVYERPDVAIQNFVNEDVAEGRAFLRAAAEAYNAGMRWYVPGQIKPQPEHYEEPAHVIVEHITKGGKGKTIRGIIRTDLTWAEAKAIDEYTFKKDGGWFIREKHLDGYVAPTDAERPAPIAKPALTPEQLAQVEADRLADEQIKEDKRRQEVGAKLRAAGASVVEKAEEELGRDRNTNTARRASMASSITQRHEAARATGLTMQNLATAIETGDAKHLSGITSRAALESLQETLRSAMYEAEKGLSYSDRERQKGRAPTAEDAKNAKFPMPMWGTAGTSLSKVLEAIKGKRGAPALAEKIRYSPGPDAEMVAALKTMIGAKEASYQIGWWNLEQVAKVARLKRAGITNTQELQDALVEYLQFREGARAEDPIKKAERALIGQKVGIDFFPTPAATAVRMAALAHIKKGDRVLEPSAGNGNLADAAKAAGAEVDVIEISSQLRDILTAKGYTVVAHDFDSFEPESKYDAILMNPPFSSRQDAAHIMRAYRMLKSGGHLAAIAGEGVFFGSDAKAQQFRDWLDTVGAEVESLDQNTFKDKSLLATTGANARLITIQK